MLSLARSGKMITSSKRHFLNRSDHLWKCLSGAPASPLVCPNPGQPQFFSSTNQQYQSDHSRWWHATALGLIVPVLGALGYYYLAEPRNKNGFLGMRKAYCEGIDFSGKLNESQEKIRKFSHINQRGLVYEWTNQPKKPLFVYDKVHDLPSVAKSQIARSPLENLPPLTDSLNKPPVNRYSHSLATATDIDTRKPPIIFRSDGESSKADEKQISLPAYVPYLIVGGGPAGMSAAQAIRASDPTAQVLMVTTENHVPYLRPALSKEVWRRSKQRQETLLSQAGDLRKHSWLVYEPESFFLPPEKLQDSNYGGVALLKNSSVIRIDPELRLAEFQDGRKITYGQCLISTGGRPRQMPRLHECSKTHTNLLAEGRVTYFRTMEDYKKLRELTEHLTEKGGRIAVIGGGFLGSELATSLAEISSKSGKDNLAIVHVFKEENPMWHVLPPHLAEHTRHFLTKKGVKVIPNSVATECHLTGIASTESDPEKMTLIIRDVDRTRENATTSLEVDHVVIAVGIEANTDLANTTPGLEVDSNHGGFLVNSEMEAVKGLYVAGDVSSFFDPLLGRRRVEHQNHAEESGRIAGRNMAATLSMERALEEKLGSSQFHSVPKMVSDIDGEDVKSLTVLSRAHYQYQSSLWSYLGPQLSWDAVGMCDAEKLETHTFMAAPTDSEQEQQQETKKSQYDHSGVVFYTKPGTGRIMGILLWNLPEDLYHDEKHYAPSRLHLARKILADRRSYSTTELSNVARDFDLHGSIDFLFQKMKEKAAEETNKPEKDVPEEKST